METERERERGERESREGWRERDRETGGRRGRERGEMETERQKETESGGRERQRTGRWKRYQTPSKPRPFPAPLTYLLHSQRIGRGLSKQATRPLQRDQEPLAGCPITSQCQTPPALATIAAHGCAV